MFEEEVATGVMFSITIWESEFEEVEVKCAVFSLITT